MFIIARESREIYFLKSVSVGRMNVFSTFFFVKRLFLKRRDGQMGGPADLRDPLIDAMSNLKKKRHELITSPYVSRVTEK